MEKKLYITPDVELITVCIESILLPASAEDYNSELGSW